MMNREQHLIQITEAAFAEARRRAGVWLVCGPGCGECCHRPFAITAIDAARLRRGLAAAPAALADDIRERARAAWSRMERDFPGSSESGTLTGDEAWREWFFQRMTGVACPVLDPETQACRLYEHRPVACRLAGPAMRAGDGVFPPCHKNYVGATAEEVAACQVVLDDPMFFEPPEEAETVVAFVCK